MNFWSKRISLAYLHILFRWKVIAPVYLVLLFGYYGLTGLFSLPRYTGSGLPFYLLFCAVFLCALHQLIFAGRALARWRCAPRLMLFTLCLLPLWAGFVPFLGLCARTSLFLCGTVFAAVLLAEGLAVAVYEGFSRVQGRRYDRRLREYQLRHSTENR